MKTKYDYLIGKKIRVLDMQGECGYELKEGIVEYISGGGPIPYQLHGTWGSLAIILGTDSYEVLE